MTRVGVSNKEADAFSRVTQRLRRYRSMVANYQACKELYNDLFPSGTQTLTDMPKGGSDTFEPERWADKRLDQAAIMQKSLEGMHDELTMLVKVVQQLEPDESAVLIRYYILGESMEIVAKHISWGHRSCWTIHNRAIRWIAEKGLLDG